MCKYIPPYEINDAMLEFVSEIMENLGKLSSVNELERLPRLRRISRIKSIHSSLAIENNTLSIEQVTDVTSLLEHYIILCDTQSQGIGIQARKCKTKNDALKLIEKKIQDGSVRNINQETGINYRELSSIER